MTGSEFGVVVAVGPEGIHDGALDLAGAEAVRRNTGIELVHVVHSLVVAPTGDDRVQSLAALTAIGRSVLTSAAERLRARVDQRVPVTTEILFGRVAATIADRVSRDGVVVLERRDAGRAERLLPMSISARVAARAHAQVLVVPAGWQAGTWEPSRVTVGVDHPLEALGQVETALGYARATGRPLVVLHAAWLAEPYQDLAFGNTTRDEWVREAERQLETALSKLPEPGDVEVTPSVDWRRPVDALVGASRVSAVVVLSRRPERAIGPHLGALTRTVLRRAACPVLVVDRT